MVDATKAQVAVTGAVMKGLTSATAPVGTSGAPTGFVDLGYVSDDGVEISLPDAGDATPIKAWQNNTTVRTVRTTSDDLPEYTFTLLETNLAAVETYFGVTVTQSATEGSFEYNVSSRVAASYVIDAIDGSDLQRDYLPRAVVSSVGSHTLANGDITSYEVTLQAERDPVKGYNFKRWATRLKTPA